MEYLMYSSCAQGIENLFTQKHGQLQPHPLHMYCKKYLALFTEVLTIHTLRCAHPWFCRRRGPQSEDDFESGKTSEDYMMKLLQYMWTQSTEYKTAAAQDLTGDESGGAATGAGTTVVAAATHSAAAAAATAPGRGAPEAESDGVGPKPTCHCNKDCQIGTFKDVVRIGIANCTFLRPPHRDS